MNEPAGSPLMSTLSIGNFSGLFLYTSEWYISLTRSPSPTNIYEENYYNHGYCVCLMFYSSTCHKQHSQRAHKTPRSDIILKKKRQWAGHMVRMSDNWALELNKWKSTTKRHPGRPKMRWADNIAKHIGKKWMTSTEDREDWHNQEEAFIQQWRVDGWKWWWWWFEHLARS